MRCAPSAYRADAAERNQAQNEIAAGDEQRWTDADELNEVQYQLMLKEWTAKFAARAEANE